MTLVKQPRRRSLFLWALICFCLTAEGEIAGQNAGGFAQNREDYIAGKPYNVGQQWVLLADDVFVEDKIGITRAMGHVNKLPNNPVIAADLPWEDYIAAPSVVFDAKANIYHMWYQGWNSTAYHSRAPQVGSKTRPENWYSYWIAYARSSDGTHWEKPLLDLYPYLEFAKTNIVHGGETEPEAPCVWLNDDQSDPARRFLMTYSGRLPDRTKGRGLMLAYSADGIHWQIDNQASPLVTRIPDGSFQVLFDPAKSRWLLFRRPDYGWSVLAPEGHQAQVRSNRRYAVSTNTKLGPGWTFPRLVLAPDEEVERRDIDHMRVFRAGTHYVGLLGMMADSERGLQQVHLAVSRDGLTWTRFPYLPAFIPQGDKGSFDAGQVHPAYAVDRGEFTYLYYSGDVVGQRVQQGYISSIGVARMRRGRWIGVKSDTDGGYLLTRQMIVSGDRLEVNFQGIIAPYMKPIEGKPLGFIRAELVRRSEPTGKLQPIPGFTLKECDPLVGDNLSGVMTWQGKADLTALRGTPVYVRFHVVSSNLWGMRFAGTE